MLQLDDPAIAENWDQINPAPSVEALNHAIRGLPPERIRFDPVGAAGTGCGLGGRVHPQIAWAKLDVFAQGAELAGHTL